MKEDPSYILSSIVILTFVITVWLQNIDDNKHYIKRNTNYDKYLVQEIVKTYAQTNVLKTQRFSRR